MSEKDFVMYRIDREIYKQLQEIKQKNDLSTINAVLKRLIDAGSYEMVQGGFGGTMKKYKESSDGLIK